MGFTSEPIFCCSTFTGNVIRLMLNNRLKLDDKIMNWQRIIFCQAGIVFINSVRRLTNHEICAASIIYGQVDHDLSNRSFIIGPLLMKTFCHNIVYVPTVQHLHLTLVPIDVLIRAADQFLLLSWTIGRAGFSSRSPLLRHAEGHRYFEDVFAEIKRTLEFLNECQLCCWLVI